MDKKKPFEKLMPMCMFMEGIIAFMLVMEIFFETIEEGFEDMFSKIASLAFSFALFYVWGHFFKRCWVITGYAAEEQERIRVAGQAA